MQMVIDIDENIFTRLFDNGTEDYEIVNDDLFAIAKSIRNGTPLPKGHGDLIDRSTLEPDTEWSDYYDYWISYSYGQIADADIIIKADGGEEDEVSD